MGEYGVMQFLMREQHKRGKAAVLLLSEVLFYCSFFWQLDKNMSNMHTNTHNHTHTHAHKQIAHTHTSTQKHTSTQALTTSERNSEAL